MAVGALFMAKKPINPAAPVVVETPAAPPAVDAVVEVVTPVEPDVPEAPIAQRVLDVAAFQAHVYPSPPCWNLVADVYTNVLARPVDEFKSVGNSVRETARTFRLQLHKSEHGFERISQPRDFAVVLMAKTARMGVHHCGIFYAGGVLHALDSGTLYQDVGTLQAEYPVMEFWARREDQSA